MGGFHKRDAVRAAELCVAAMEQERAVEMRAIRELMVGRTS